MEKQQDRVGRYRKNPQICPQKEILSTFVDRSVHGTTENMKDKKEFFQERVYWERGLRSRVFPSGAMGFG